MNTTLINLNGDKALGLIPARFRDRIIATYIEIKKRSREASIRGDFDSVGLSVGKFCETVLRFLQFNLTNQCIPFNKNISNFNDECRNLILLPSTVGNESLRVIIPRALIFLYTIRGKRGIGHVGGDIEPNSIDMSAIVHISDWVICELVRIFHNLAIEDAQSLVDSITIKDNPIIWEIDGKKRVLLPSLKFKEKVLLLLYCGIDSSASSKEIFTWVEHSNMTNFRRDILRPLHEEKLIEYNQKDEIIHLSPLGVAKVEILLKKFNI